MSKSSTKSPTAPAAARSLIGRHVGIVRRVVRAVPSERDAPIHAFAAETAFGTAAGGGHTEEAALMACLGEAAERYAAATYDERDLVWGPAPGREWAPFSDAQRARPDFPFATAGPVRWFHGAPAFAVFMPYNPAPGESVYAPSFSTGLAAGPTIAAARESALLEVIERDALINAWAAGEPRPRVGDVVDLTSDLAVPVAGCLIEADVISFGCAAARTFEVAAAKARLEARLGQIYVRSLVRRSPPREVVDFADHARYYTDHPEHRGALNLLKGREGRPPADGDPFAAVDAYWWRDLTTPDLASAGFHVARVLVPGLTPIHAWEAWPFLGAPRLRVRNRFPHPLP